MNLTNCPYDNESVDEYLQDLQNETNLSLIPAITMMSIFAVTGLIGNILVLIVYSKRFTLSPTKVLIMTIAIFDLVANIGAIPSEALIMYDSWNFRNTPLCKSKVLLGAFSTVGGGMSLLVVAVVRYRKVCHPYEWQVTIRQAILASVAVAGVSFLVSIPYIIIYGIKSKETKCLHIKGYECFADDYYSTTKWPLMNNILFFVLYVAFSTSLVVLYVLVGVTAWKHGKRRKQSSKSSNLRGNTEPKTTGPTADTEGNRSQRQSLSSNSGIQASTTDVQQLVTSSSSKGRHKNLLCCIRRDSRNSVCVSQIHVVLSSFTPTNDSDGAEYSRSTCSENGNQDVTISESISFDVSGSGETNRNMTNSTGNINTVDNLEESNARQNMNATNKDELSLHMDAIPNTSTYKPAEQINDSLLDTLDPPHKTQEMDVVQNSHESFVDRTCMQNKTTTLTASGSDNEQTAEKRQKNGTQKNFNLRQIIEKRASKSNSLGNTRKSSKRSKPLGKMAAILIIISAIYVLGYIPFLLMAVLRTTRPDVFNDSNISESSATNLFHRLYFINSAANPIIYSLCNVKFRHACKRLFIFTSNRRV